MSIAESILPEFDMEMVGTRKVLERVPDDKLEIILQMRRIGLVEINECLDN